MRYKLIIAYDGAGFHGWQEQTGDDQSHLRTVQKVVRQAVQQVVRQPVTLRGASRTDTGVHALGQVAQFDAHNVTVPLDRLAMAINSRLPDDVEVRHAEPTDESFDAISQATDKQYRYRIWNTAHRPLGLRHQVYHCWLDLDVEAMNNAAARLVGAHDFAAFTNAGHGRITTVREVFACGVERALEPEIHMTIRGNGFLYNMVRIIAGTLIEVGRGHWSPDRIDQLLASGDRHQAGPTLPPNGLCLEWIKY